LWFGKNLLASGWGEILMAQDEWFLLSVPLVIFLVVMIAASLTLPQP
jgi:hypothetical protein